MLRMFERFFEWMLSTYQWTLDKVLAFVDRAGNHPATFFITIALYIVVPKGFFPTEDTGYVIGITEGATDISVSGNLAASARLPTLCAQTRRSPT